MPTGSVLVMGDAQTSLSESLRSMLARRWSLLAISALVLLQFLLLAPLFGAGEPAGDDLSIHLAETSYLARALSQGDLNLWNPTANAGFASGYYYQLLPQLLPALFYLLTGALFSLLFVFKLFIALPLALLPATSYRALRVAGVARAEAVGAAFAVGFVFAPYKWGLGIDSMFTTGLYSQAWGVLFVPLALAYGHHYLRHGKGLGRALGYALLVGLCHPFFGFALAPALLLTPWWRAGLTTAARRGLGLAGLVLLASAFFWLPIIVHYDSFGGFPARVADEAGIAPARFVRTLIHGGFFDLGRLPLYTYLLVPTLAFAVWKRVAILLYLLAAGACFAAAVALGPVLGKTDGDLVPAIRFLGMMQLLWAALAGLGAVALGRALLESKRLAAVVQLNRAVLALLAIAAMTHVITTARFDTRVRLMDDHAGQNRPTLMALIDELKALPQGRIIAARELGTQAHWWMYLPTVYAGVPAMRAYGGAALQSSPNFVYLRTYPYDGDLGMWGVRYALLFADLPAPWPGAKVLATVKNHKLVEIPGPGLFRPVGILSSTAGDRKTREKQIAGWLRSTEAKTGVHLELGGDGRAAEKRPVEIKSEYEGLSRYDAAVDTPEGGIVALAVTYHPGWRATIDGKSAHVRRISPDFMAVDVPPGDHMIIFRFSRPWWTWALLLVSLLALIGASLRERTLAEWIRRWTPRPPGVERDDV